MNPLALTRPTFRRPAFALQLALVFALVPLARAQLVTSSQTYSVARTIDGSATSIFFNLPVAGTDSSSRIFDTRLSLTFAKLPDLSDDPPYFSEVGVLLRQLDDSFRVLTQVTLLPLGGFSDGLPSSGFNGTLTFDDSATLSVLYDPDQIHAGKFRPAAPLAAFNGSSFGANWELRLVDGSFQNPLLFRSATLSVLAGAAAVASAVPEPSTYGVFALALIGLVALKRRWTC